MYNTVVHNPIRLVRVDGEVIRTFSNFDSLLANWPLIRRLDIGKQWKKQFSWWEEAYPTFSPPKHQYALIDSLGDIIDPDKVRESYNKLHPRSNNGRWKWGRSNKASRFGSYYRHPRTFQERKWNCDMEDGAPPPRGRRRQGTLPCDWDDRIRDSVFWKNWKYYRKHQWKPKRGPKAPFDNE